MENKEMLVELIKEGYIDSSGFLTKKYLDEFRKELGEAIRKQREKHYSSCYASSKASGVNPTTALNIENGEMNYSIDNLIKSLSAINCSLSIVSND